METNFVRQKLIYNTNLIISFIYFNYRSKVECSQLYYNNNKYLTSKTLIRYEMIIIQPLPFFLRLNLLQQQLARYMTKLTVTGYSYKRKLKREYSGYLTYTINRRILYHEPKATP